MTGWSKSAEVVGSKPAIKGLRPHGLISHAWRWGAGVISAGAGLVSILSYTHSLKSKFDADSLAAGTLAVRWVRITPLADTATSIGDTIQLAVTAADARGNALLGVPTLWNSTDTAVASVDSAGTVVARGGGRTAITVTIAMTMATMGRRTKNRDTVQCASVAAGNGLVVTIVPSEARAPSTTTRAPGCSP